MYVKEINKKDALYVLENLRLEDKHEAIVQKGEDYKQIILNEFMNPKARIYLGYNKSDNTPVAMGGFSDTQENGIGLVSLLSTPEIENNKTSLLRYIIKAFEEIDSKYWLTWNILFSENKFAKRWLKKLGYRFDNPKPDGLNIPDGFEFFYRIREVRGLGMREPVRKG